MANQIKTKDTSTSKRPGRHADDTPTDSKVTNEYIDRTGEQTKLDKPLKDPKNENHKKDTPKSISVYYAIFGVVITFLATAIYFYARVYIYHESNVASPSSPCVSTSRSESDDICDTTKRMQPPSSEYAPSSVAIENTPVVGRQEDDKVSSQKEDIASKQSISPVVSDGGSYINLHKENSHSEKGSQSFESESSSLGTESTTGERLTPSPEKVVECDSGWTEHNGSCYKFFATNKSWNLSRSSCESFRSRLVTVDTWAEHTYLKKIYVPQFVKNHTSMTEVWLGGEYSGAAWRWISTNQPIDPRWSSWGQRGATSHRLGHCLCYVILDHNYCKMYDNNCNYSRPYICEHEH